MFNHNHNPNPKWQLTINGGLTINGVFTRNGIAKEEVMKKKVMKEPFACMAKGLTTQNNKMNEALISSPSAGSSTAPFGSCLKP